jgi:hypothetical protein
MNEKVIEDLFKKVSEHFDIVPEEAKEFFSMFVEETLAYRDELIKDGKEPLTIDEVQKALNFLEETLATKQVRADLPGRINNLIERWIYRLNERN